MATQGLAYIMLFCLHDVHAFPSSEAGSPGDVCLIRLEEREGQTFRRVRGSGRFTVHGPTGSAVARFWSSPTCRLAALIFPVLSSFISLLYLCATNMVQIKNVIRSLLRKEQYGRKAEGIVEKPEIAHSPIQHFHRPHLDC
jgi:hypothetical protein